MLSRAFILSLFLFFFFIYRYIYIWDSFVIFMQVTQQVFVVEEWVRDARNGARAKAHSRVETEKSLEALK